MRIWLALTLGTAVLLTGRADADEPAVAAMYGSGVHAYYAGGYQQSFDSLSRVIRIGTADPRAYYFRGLAALRMGRRDEAVADFTKGAELEADGWSMRTVSRSLERVQGTDRLLLERSRNGARLALAQQQATAATSLTRSPSMEFGRRYSGIGGTATPRSPKPAAADESTSDTNRSPPKAEIVPDENVRSPKEETDKPDPLERWNPFGDGGDSGRSVVSETVQAEPIPQTSTPNGLGSNTQRDQIEEQAELRDAEATDFRDQQEAMAERDAAAGDR